MEVKCQSPTDKKCPFRMERRAWYLLRLMALLSHELTRVDLAQGRYPK